MKPACVVLPRVSCVFFASALLPLTLCSQSSNCVPAPPGLISWWRAEGNANDAAGGNSGVLNGSVSFVTGRVGQAFSFNGINADVRVAASASLNVGLGDGFTIEAWINPASVAEQRPLVEWNNGAYGVNLWLQDTNSGGSGLSFNITETSLQDHIIRTAPGAITAGYQHVAATYNKTNGTTVLYINGVLAVQSSVGTFTPRTLGDLYFGLRPAGPGAGFRFQGSMDEVSLYGRALSAAEIQAIYQAESAGKCTGPSAPVVIGQPTNQTVVAGATATFELTALGTAPLDYQWLFNGTNIVGATDAVLVITNVQSSNVGPYSAIVTNLYGATTSVVAMLTIGPPVSPCVPAPAGLVSWWRAAGNALDSGSGNNGVLVGNAAYGPGRVGQAFVLDGSGDGVSVGNPASLQLQNFTIEAWVKRANAARVSLDPWNSGLIFCYAGGGYGFALHDNGELFLSKVGFSGVDSSLAITDTNNFHHVAVTKTGSAVVFYLDGVPETVGAYDPGFVFTGPAAIGARGGDLVASFLGSIDEVSVYNRALEAAEIQAIYQVGGGGKCTGPSAPLIIVQPLNQTAFVGESPFFAVSALGTAPLAFQWRFNGSDLAGANNSTLTLPSIQFSNAGIYSVVVTNHYGSATSSNALLTVNPAPPCVPPPTDLVSWWRAESNTLDASDANHGVLIGNTAYGQGRVGQAFVFDGDADAVLVGNPASLQLQDFTIEAWIKRTSPTIASFDFNGGVLFGYGPGGYNLAIFDDGTPFLGRVGIDYVTPNASITDTNWHHVAVTKLGSGVVFYIDGVAYLLPAYSSIFTFTTLAAVGGMGNNPGNSFYGSIDDLAVYNRALSASEIQAIYQAASAGKCTTPSPPVITAQPANQTVVVGGTPSFAVSALGTAPLAFQWRFNGSDLAGANNSTLTLPSVQFSNAGIYSVVVTNLYGSATSSNALLTVNPAPPCAPSPTGLLGWWKAEGNAQDQLGINHGTVANQAGFGSGQVGQAFTLDGNGDLVQLTNSPLFQLQGFTIECWIRRANVSIASFGANGHGAFFGYGPGGYIFFMDAQGRLLLGKTGIDQRSSSMAVTDLANHHVAVTKSGSAVTFYLDGLPETVSAYTSTFTFTTPAAIGGRGDDFGNSFFGAVDELAIYGRALSTNEIQSIYAASVAGKCASPVQPFITAHPQNATVLAGANTSFSVVAGGTVPLSYQWRFNETNIPNATASTLSLTNVQFADAGNYSVQVTNVAGSAISSNALLTVNLPTPVLRVGNTSIMAGARFTLPVTLAANGNENALGFSLTFSTQRLSLASVELGSGAAGATMLVNSSLVWTGRVGIALAYPPQFTFTAGTQEVARLTFYSLPLLGPGSINSTIVFGDQPILRELLNSQLQPITANYNNGTVTLLTTVFESDVVPRPNGNQAVSTADWLQVSRYAARLDAPTNSAEFQRADSAPRATLGDGQLKVTDWVQTGRNLGGLDPLLAIGGPTNEVAPVLAGPSATRLLRVVNTNITQGETTTMSVLLDAQGDENAVGFTLNFDPAGLGFEGVVLGADAGPATLQPNLLQAAAGRLGIALALPTGTTFSPGAKEILRANASGLLAGAFPITINDQIVTRSVSDVFAGELPVNFVNGTLTIDPLITSPSLFISQSGTNVVLSWPLAAANFTLQSLGSTNGLSGNWSDTPALLQTNGSTVIVTLPVTNESRFFRLFHP